MSKRAKEVALKAYPPTYTIVKRHAKRVQSELVDTHKPVRAIFEQGYEQAEKDLGWHSVKESLPPIDMEVIVLTDDINGKIVPNAHKICYGHRPNLYDEIKHYDVVTYNGWNIPGVTHWMYLPKITDEE